MKQTTKSPEYTIERVDFDEIDSMAIIISSESAETRLESISKIAESVIGKNYTSHPDFIVPEVTEKNSIGIGEIKNFISRLKFKPYSASKKIAVIENAEEMTTEAQNSLLKTLEDIPSKTIIVLATTNHQKLLPTIVSRCQLFEIQSSEAKKGVSSEFDPEKILKSSLYEKFQVVEEIASIKKVEERREMVKNLIGELVIYFEKDLDKLPRNATKLKLLQQTMTMIEQNVNLKLALESMMINLEE